MKMMKNDYFQDEKGEIDLSKSEINAEKIMRRIHTHNIDAGGILSLITGAQGSSKTSVMLSFMDYTIEHHKDEKIFWSSTYCAPLQFIKSKNNYNIMVKKDSGVTFHDRNNKLK
jgi:Tfp pilus assembly pilus retraction ATPase PilT